MNISENGGSIIGSFAFEAKNVLNYLLFGVKMSTTLNLKAAYQNLSPAERRVADYVLENPEEASHMTIDCLAANAGVSLPSVTRLTKKLGYAGFSEFKIALAGSVAAKTGRAEKLALLDDDTDTEFADKLLMGQRSAMAATSLLIDRESLRCLADHIVSAKRVVFFGLGSSIAAARNINEDFLRIGIDSAIMSNPNIMGKYARLLGKEDVFIGLSRTGLTKRTLDCMTFAKAQGSFTAFFTNNEDSVAVAKADLCFVTPRLDEIYDYCGLETNAMHYAVLEVLSIMVARKLARFSKEDYVRILVEPGN